MHQYQDRPYSLPSKTYPHVNGFAIIDESYCGENDQWFFPAYATRRTVINKGDRICQFRIQMKQPSIVFTEVEHLKESNRGGFGSTGRN